MKIHICGSKNIKIRIILEITNIIEQSCMKKIKMVTKTLIVVTLNK